jgi:hypothetical protein
MLVARETIERDLPRPVTGFTIGETVHVLSLGRTGRITGMEGGRWLVCLTEGDAPVPCAASNLQRRQTLFG